MNTAHVCFIFFVSRFREVRTFTRGQRILSLRHIIPTGALLFLIKSLIYERLDTFLLIPAPSSNADNDDLHQQNLFRSTPLRVGENQAHMLWSAAKRVRDCILSFWWPVLTCLYLRVSWKLELV